MNNHCQINGHFYQVPAHLQDQVIACNSECRMRDNLEAMKWGQLILGTAVLFLVNPALGGACLVSSCIPEGIIVCRYFNRTNRKIQEIRDAILQDGMSMLEEGTLTEEQRNNAIRLNQLHGPM